MPAATRVDAVGLDTSMDLGTGRSMRSRQRTALQGNLDPLALVAGGAGAAARDGGDPAGVEGTARSCSTWATASCRRRRPSMSRALVEQVRAA